MLCERCGHREATVRSTRVDGATNSAATEELCLECAGPLDKLNDLFQRMVAATQGPLTPESLAELEQIQGETTKLMMQSPLLPPGMLRQLREFQENPKLRPLLPPNEAAE